MNRKVTHVIELIKTNGQIEGSQIKILNNWIVSVWPYHRIRIVSHKTKAFTTKYITVLLLRVLSVTDNDKGITLERPCFVL